MEVVAAVSSVAGIASLVGQSLSGLTKLYDFFQGCQNASKTISRFLSELTSLEKALREVEDLVSKIGDSLQKPEESILVSLTFHLEDCAKDLASWFNFVHEQHLSKKPSPVTIFKKILLAIKSKDIKDIFTQISSHRQGISMSLSATRRLLDIEHLNKAAALMMKVDEAAGYGELTVNALGRLENRLEVTSLPSLGAKSTSET